MIKKNFGVFFMPHSVVSFLTAFSAVRLPVKSERMNVIIGQRQPKLSQKQKFQLFFSLTVSSELSHSNVEKIYVPPVCDLRLFRSHAVIRQTGT